MMEVLTGFGDSAVLLPLSAVIFLWLLWARSTGSALAWLFALTLLIGATAVLKIYFSACPPGPALHSPSGHTSFSVVVYGAVTAIVAAERRQRWQRIAIWLTGASLVTAIGVSRIVLGSHTRLEVEIGLLVGTAALAAFSAFYSRQKVRRGGLIVLVVMIIAVVGLLHGRRLDFESLFRHLGLRLHIRTLVCG